MDTRLPQLATVAQPMAVGATQREAFAPKSRLRPCASLEAAKR